MAQVQASDAPGEAAHQRIERLLARYPALSERELADLVHWFEREASALDVALVASNERIRHAYERFRVERIDRFTLRDLVGATAFAVIACGALFAIIWLAP